MPDAKSSVAIYGSNFTPYYFALAHQENENLLTEMHPLELSSTLPWILKAQDLATFRHTLKKISKLHENPNSNFKNSVLNFIYLYSKCTTTHNPTEKIVYIISALESILLKNTNEPIQQNLSERLSVLTEKDLTDRKNLIKSVKEIYKVRSKYLHHGFNSSAIDEIRKFMPTPRKLLHVLLGNIEKFKSKDDFIEAVDDLKLS